MRGPGIVAFAREHGLKLVSVAELITHRQRSEKLVTRVGEFPIATMAGPARAVAYRTAFDPVEHLAVIFGEIADGREVPVRLHREAIIEDVFAAKSKLDRVMSRFSGGRGVIVYLREGAVGVAGAGGRTRDGHRPADEGHDTAAERQREWREVGLGAQILRDLGISSIRLLPRASAGISAWPASASRSRRRISWKGRAGKACLAPARQACPHGARRLFRGDAWARGLRSLCPPYFSNAATTSTSAENRNWSTGCTRVRR